MATKKTPPEPPRQKPSSKKEGEQPKSKSKAAIDKALDKLRQEAIAEEAVNEIKSRGSDKLPKEKQKPTGVKLTPEQEAEKFEQVLYNIAEEGLSVRKACPICNVSTAIFYRHMELTHIREEFTELTEEETRLMAEDREKRYARAREARNRILLEETLEIADEVSYDFKTLDNGREIPDKEQVLRSKLRVETRLKYLEMTEPTKYGKKIETTLIGKEGAPPAVVIQLGSGIAPPEEQITPEQP
jgi:hypothetical protein